MVGMPTIFVWAIQIQLSLLHPWDTHYHDYGALARETLSFQASLSKPVPFFFFLFFWVETPTCPHSQKTQATAPDRDWSMGWQRLVGSLKLY